MAIVPNKAHVGGAVDQAFCTHDRVSAGTPNGALVPNFAGEIVLDTTDAVRYKAVGMLNTMWVPIDPQKVV